MHADASTKEPWSPPSTMLAPSARLTSPRHAQMQLPASASSSWLHQKIPPGCEASRCSFVCAHQMHTFRLLSSVYLLLILTVCIVAQVIAGAACSNKTTIELLLRLANSTEVSVVRFRLRAALWVCFDWVVDVWLFMSTRCHLTCNHARALARMHVQRGLVEHF